MKLDMTKTAIKLSQQKVECNARLFVCSEVQYVCSEKQRCIFFSLEKGGKYGNVLYSKFNAR